jgi:hypothetical protein
MYKRIAIQPSYFFSFGIASRRQRAMHQGIHWGSMVIGILGLSKRWGQEVGVTTFRTLMQLRWATMLLPMVWMTLAHLASADSVFNSLIADSNQLGYYL